MATCPRCGFKRLGLVFHACYVCRQRICERCEREYGWKEELVYRAPDAFMAAGPSGWVPQRMSFLVCSERCADTFAWTYITKGAAPALSGQSYVLGGVTLHPFVAERAVRLHEQYRKQRSLDLAQKLLRAADFGGAARAYQDIGMWDEAAEARKRARQTVVTQVQVNLNDLIDQLRSAGISTDYSCPACGGRIPISGETAPAKLSSCQYCGAVIHTTDLVDFLSKVVDP